MLRSTSRLTFVGTRRFSRPSQAKWEKNFRSLQKRVENLESQKFIHKQDFASPAPLPQVLKPKLTVFEEDLAPGSAVARILQDFDDFLQANGSQDSTAQIRKLHIVLEGNPGVGKNTLADLLAVKMHHFGMISTPFVAKLTAKEVYGSPNPFPPLEILLEESLFLIDKGDAWEDPLVLNGFLNQLRDIGHGVVIFSVGLGGYQKLTSLCPSFQEVFPIHYRLPNLTEEQITFITQHTLQRHQLALDRELDSNPKKFLQSVSFKEMSTNNAHVASHLALRATFNGFKRETSMFGEHIVYAEDFADPARVGAFNLGDLDQLVGRQEISQYLEKFVFRAQVAAENGPLYKAKFLKGTNFFLVGNPGSGRHTVATMIGNMLYSLGYLSKDPRSSPQLFEPSPQHFRETLEVCNGEFLIVQDVSQLGQLDNQIRTIFELSDATLVFIDTNEKIQKFISANPFLASFFSKRLFFPDYTHDDLVGIACKLFQDSGYVLDDNAEALLDKEIKISPKPNATYVSRMVNSIISQHFDRLVDEQEAETGVITERDFIPLEKLQSAEQIFQELDAMVGLKKVKSFIRDLYAQCLTTRERKKRGITKSNELETLHMLFKGNPGTGKTTVAGLIGKLFKSIGLLSSGHLVVSNREDIRQGVANALGGVLLIDEAYGISTEEFDVHGNWAITTLVDLMEKHRNEFVLIMAGYPKEMAKFLRMNSGLRSRIPHEIVFDDFTNEEKFDIAKSMFQTQQFTLNEAAFNKLRVTINAGIAGNARGIRHLVQRLILQQNLRISKQLDCPTEEFLTVTEADFQDPHANENESSKILAKFDQLTGLSGIKDFVHSLYNRMVIEQERVSHSLEATKHTNSFHMVFKGNPGTGKTMVAQLMAQLLHSVNIIPTTQLTIAKRDDLVAEYLGQTEHRTRNLIESAIGGVLFIDEAYHLMIEDLYGKVALTVLIDMMEQHRHDLVVIIAGYSKEMDELLRTNSGFMSRFLHQVEFKNYTPNELVQIATEMFHSEAYKLSPEAEIKVKALAQKGMEGNARDIRNLVSKSILKHNTRVVGLTPSERTSEMLQTIQEQDIEQAKDLDLKKYFS